MCAVFCPLAFGLCTLFFFAMKFFSFVPPPPKKKPGYFKLKNLGERTEPQTRFLVLFMCVEPKPELRQFWFTFQKGGVIKPCQTLEKESTQERPRKRNKGRATQGGKGTIRTEPSTSGLKRIKSKNLPSLVSSVDYLFERVAVFTMHMGPGYTMFVGAASLMASSTVQNNA